MASNDTVQPANQNAPGLFDSILASVQGGISAYRADVAQNQIDADIASGLRVPGSGATTGFVILAVAVIGLYFVFD